MKKYIGIYLILFVSYSLTAQTFELKFASFENYILQNYSLEKIKNSIATSYTLIKQSETEWKFRDDSKSWEATLYIQFDKSTKKITEIQFSAPQSRVFDFLDELEKNLGYKVIGTEGQMDILENKNKKLGAKLVPANYLGQGMYLYRIFRI